MDRYDVTEKSASGEELGRGTYGVVYRARDRETGNTVALKKIKLEVDDEGIPSTTLREIAVLKQLVHPNVVGLYDVLQNNGRLYLVFEYLDYDLKKFMDRHKRPLDPHVVMSFTYQLLLGLEYCHVRGVMHRDLKPQNLLVNNEGYIKLADFGLARAFIPPIRPYTHEVVTLWYRAPEILLGSRTYGLPVDIWSAGTIFAEMINKRALIPGDSEIDEIFKIFMLRGTPDEESWPGVTALEDWNDSFPVWPPLRLESRMKEVSDEGLDLLDQMLQLNPMDRISARQALRHPYFDPIHEMQELGDDG